VGYSYFSAVFKAHGDLSNDSLESVSLIPTVRTSTVLFSPQGPFLSDRGLTNIHKPLLARGAISSRGERGPREESKALARRVFLQGPCEELLPSRGRVYLILVLYLLLFQQHSEYPRRIIVSGQIGMQV
jgi:hypothetical protein